MKFCQPGRQQLVVVYAVEAAKHEHQVELAVERQLGRLAVEHHGLDLAVHLGKDVQEVLGGEAVEGAARVLRTIRIRLRYVELAALVEHGREQLREPAFTRTVFEHALVRL